MSTIIDKKSEGMKFHIERFASAMEVVDVSRERQITDNSFEDIPSEKNWDWRGCKSWDDALDMMRNGYQPTVEKLRGLLKVNAMGNGKRITFQNNIVGYAPVVPLALKGVPNNMIDTNIKPIKCKVIDVYYDMTSSCGVDSDDIIKNGQKLLGAILELEAQGYAFNLYAVQTYTDDNSCDMLCVKVKSSSQPIDLKRISFPLTHTSFFRAIGFDWYSKMPGGKYRFGYGRGLAYRKDRKKTEKIAKDLFGQNAIYIACAKIIKDDVKHIKEVLENGNSKA